MPNKRIIANEDIEKRAESCIARYEEKYGLITSPPVPIEKILAHSYKLTVLWDDIEEYEHEEILGGLNTSERLIILNENKRDLFNDKPGLERSTIGHEAGHWEFDVDKGALDHPTLFEKLSKEQIMLRSSKKHGQILIFRNTTYRATDISNPSSLLSDEPDQKIVVNRFAAALNMPRNLIEKASQKFNLYMWSTKEHGLYSMAEAFEVNISALVVRLRQLGYIYVDKNGSIHKSQDEVCGQGTLF